jgi:transposase
MAIGHRKTTVQLDLFVSADSLPLSDGHVFYAKLNRLLCDDGFDPWLEELCAPYYSQNRGRPGIPPGIYFRMLLVGYFEGIQSQRGIAWRCADSLSLRKFLGIPLTQSTPDHSSLTVIRERLPQSVYETVFEWVLKLAVKKKLLSGKTVAVDSTTLEADAAMKSIIRRDSGEDWRAYIIGLMRAEGVIQANEEPSLEDLRRFDKKRKDKKVSNEDWQSSTDPEAEIAKMKDGTTHLAYKAENVVDIKSSMIVGAQVGPASDPDSSTLEDSLHSAQVHLANAGLSDAIQEVTADKGYYSTNSLTNLAEHTDYRSYIPEPKLPKGRKRNLRDRTAEERRAIKNNRRRSRSEKGRELQRRRGEKVERSFAHTLETGGGRRTRLRGVEKTQKRYLILTAAYNLGVILRSLFGIGTARGLQGARSGSRKPQTNANDLLGTLIEADRDLKSRYADKNLFWIKHLLIRNPINKISQNELYSTGC